MGTGMGSGPDLKARTDLAVREERARLEARRKQSPPERLRQEFEGSAQPDSGTTPGLVRRLWQRIFGP
jgi:hypothetical protein